MTSQNQSTGTFLKLLLSIVKLMSRKCAQILFPPARRASACFTTHFQQCRHLENGSWNWAKRVTHFSGNAYGYYTFVRRLCFCFRVLSVRVFTACLYQVLSIFLSVHIISLYVGCNSSSNYCNSFFACFIMVPVFCLI